jgi:hypothetical protein
MIQCRRICLCHVIRGTTRQLCLPNRLAEVQGHLTHNCRAIVLWQSARFISEEHLADSGNV